MCGLLPSPPFARFICVRMWGCGVLPTAQPAPLSATLSPALSVYLCANVGPQGLLVVTLPAMLVPHSASLGPATATGVFSTQVPVSAPPTGLDECLFCISLVLDPLAVRFSVSSGCSRRRSVSTYAIFQFFLSVLLFSFSHYCQLSLVLTNSPCCSSPCHLSDFLFLVSFNFIILGTWLIPRSFIWHIQ